MCHRVRHTYARRWLDAEPPASPSGIMVDNRSLLEVSNLDVRFVTRKSLLGRPQSWFQAVDDVSFSLSEGETLGIVGESGSGKTTIGHALLKLTSSRGSIRLSG